jgi:hypothetical protein
MLGIRFGFEVSCECPDGYRTFKRFWDRNLVQQGRVFADKGGGPRNWIVFSSKKQMVLIKWFFILRALSKLARGYLSSVQKTRHSAFGGRKESEMRMITVKNYAAFCSCSAFIGVPVSAVCTSRHWQFWTTGPGFNVLRGIQQF